MTDHGTGSRWKEVDGHPVRAASLPPTSPLASPPSPKPRQAAAGLMSALGFLLRGWLCSLDPRAGSEPTAASAAGHSPNGPSRQAPCRLQAQGRGCAGWPRHSRTQQPAPRGTLVSPRVGRPRFLGLAPTSPPRSVWGLTDPAGFGGVQGNSTGENVPTTVALPTGQMKALQKRSNLCNLLKKFSKKEIRRTPASSTKVKCFRGGRV